MKVTLKAESGPVVMDLRNPRDHISRVIIKNKNWYEFDLLTDLRRRVKPGVAIDVGAHIGNHSLFMAAHGFEVIAFEPNAESYEQLVWNVRSNPKLNVDAHYCAVGRDFGYGSAVIPNPTNSGMAYIEERPDSTIPIVPLDSLETDVVSVIKIDVEGHEIDVLLGARMILASYHPVLYIEASTPEAKARVDDFLAPYGYELRGRFCKTDTWCYSVVQPVSLSLSIMAHPKRHDMAVELATQLERQGGPMYTAITWDQINDRWDTGRRSMLAYDPTKTHHLVIQDDAVIPDNFIELVNQAIEIPPPESPLCLYAGRALSRRLRGTAIPSWFTMPGVNWGVGIIVPTDVIEEMVEFGDGRTEENYDLRVSRFFQSKKILTWYPIPSLVQHRRTPSLVAGRGSRRTAALYVGEPGAQFNPHGPVRHLSWSR